MNKLALQTQAGVTLVFSLVILVTLTILGVTSFQNTRTELSMAGNLRESGLTFNAAEAGLRAAENVIDSSASAAVFSNTAIGYFDESDLDPDYVNDATWTNLPHATTTLAYVLAQPKYIVKYLGDRSENEVAKVNIGGYGSSQPGITVSNFRVTARGTGQAGNARRYVQSYFGKDF